jgi:hypothetical protein
MLSMGARAAETPEVPRAVELKGRVVCLPEEMQRRFQVELPTKHEHVFGFKTESGEYYTLLRTKASEALFADERLREKDLIVKGRVFPGSRVLEITGTLRSVKDGKICELYYFCEICVIKTISPDPCLCCQAPVELREEPIN